MDAGWEGPGPERQQADLVLADDECDGNGEGVEAWPRRVTMALVYDFDGTLAPGNMQERQFIPDIGMTPREFWSEVDRLSSVNQADGVLMYMYFMLRKAAEQNVPVHVGDLRERGRLLEYFPEVLDWFERMNEYGADRGLRVEHYILSSGNAEIIEGTPVANLVDGIYASRFLFDEDGKAVWPALAVNYTTKTQFLFRINKGAHDLKRRRRHQPLRGAGRPARAL